jgi:tRNA-2-methylthio-N6-dimethylallyladenosine synthase
VDDVGFEGLFVFTYSPRPGTTAHRVVDDVPEAEKLRRLHVLNERQQRFQAGRNALRVGGREEVLVDTVVGEGRVSGRARDFRIVHLDGDVSDIGRTMPVEITGSGPNSLTGRRARAN